MFSFCYYLCKQFFCYFRFRFFPVLISLCMSVFSGISPKVVSEFSRNFRKELALYNCIYFYLATGRGGGRNIAICVAVRLSFCLSARISQNSMSKLQDIFRTCGRRSVLFWRHCDVLYTSGFLDDVTLSHNGANGPELHVSSSSPGGSSGGKIAAYDCTLLFRYQC